MAACPSSSPSSCQAANATLSGPRDPNIAPDHMDRLAA